MRFLALVAVLAVPVGVAVAAEDAPPPAPIVKPVDQRLIACGGKYRHTGPTRDYIRTVYDRPEVTQRARYRIKWLINCAYTPKARKNLKRYLRKVKQRRVERQKMLAVTPYDCGAMGRFAIPCSIVACESGGSWSAANPSGAIGAYQFLGWPVPWPVRTEADKLAHHRMAATLYAGGAGASHWAQCL